MKRPQQKEITGAGGDPLLPTNMTAEDVARELKRLEDDGV